MEEKGEKIATESENWLIFQAEYHTAYNPHYVQLTGYQTIISYSDSTKNIKYSSLKLRTNRQYFIWSTAQAVGCNDFKKQTKLQYCI